MYTSVDWS